MYEFIVTVLVTPFYEVTMFGTRFSWLFLLSAVVIAMLSQIRDWKSDGKKSWSLFQALLMIFPKKVFLHPSALLDYRYALVNYVLQILVFEFLMLSVTRVASATIWLITQVIGEMPAEPATPSLAMLVLFGTLILLALDGGLFFAHWLMHRFPILCEFHKVHHSAETLTPITVLRMHPVDMIINSCFTSLFIGIVNGAFFYAYSGPSAEMGLLGANVAVMVFFFFGYHLRHSHVWVMFPKGIREIISSPALHLIHHSTNPKHFNKNFARIFVFWDRLSNSLYIPQQKEEIEFGIGGDGDGEFNTVYDLYVLPFVAVTGRLFPSRKRQVQKRVPHAEAVDHDQSLRNDENH